MTVIKFNRNSIRLTFVAFILCKLYCQSLSCRLLINIYFPHSPPQANKENKINSDLQHRPIPPPPTTPLAKGVYLNTPTVKKDKRQSSSRFNVSKNCELVALPLLSGEFFVLFHKYFGASFLVGYHWDSCCCFCCRPAIRTDKS